MTQSFEIDFKIMLGDKTRQWISINELPDKSTGLLDAYLRIENLRGGHFQGGFFINIDGIPWSDDSTVDEFWMTTTWFTALIDILSGHHTARATPWEESNLTFTRLGDELMLEDVHFSGSISMPKVQVPLFAFAEKIIGEGEKFSALVNAIQAEIKTRRMAGVTDEIELKLTEIEQNLPIGLEQEIQMLAIKLKMSQP